MAQLKAIKDRIIFQFLEDTSSGSFANTTDWGFVIKDAKEDMKVARWARVNVVGKDVKDVTPEDYILIEPLMWTLHIEVGGQRYWTTNESKVMLLSKERPKGYL